MPSVTDMPRVVLIENSAAQEIPLGQELTIGRAHSNLLRLDGEEISRLHAIIYKSDDGYQVRDLDSKNGVWLNGSKVSNASIAPGDHLRFGSYTVLFDPPPEFNISSFIRSHHDALESIAHSPKAASLDTSYIFSPGNLLPIANTPHGQGMWHSREINCQLDEALADPTPDVAELFCRFQSHLLTGIPDITLTRQALAARYLNAAVATLSADRGVIVLREATDDKLELGALRPADREIAVNRVVLRSVLGENKAVLCDDAQHHTAFAATKTVKKDKIQSLISFPLQRNGNPVGLIYADSTSTKSAFKHHHLMILCLASRLMMTAFPLPIKSES